MRPTFSIRSALVAGVLALAAGVPAQQSGNAVQEAVNPFSPEARRQREERIRQHEERIRQIIRERQEEQRLREEAERLERERAAQPPPQQPAEQKPAADPAIQSQPAEARAIGTVVLYYNFPTAANPRQLDTFVESGTQFLSEIILLNDAAADVTGLSLALTYDKRFVRPVKVFDDAIRKRLKEPPTFSIDRRNGVISYRGTFSQAENSPEMTPIQIVWESIRPTDFTDLNFAFAPDDADPDAPHTAVYADGRNILGLGFDPIDGVLGGGVNIGTPGGAEFRLQGKKEDLRQMYLGAIGASARVGLRLEAPSEPVRVGDVFPVHVRLVNPEGAQVDSIAFTMGYDPRLLEVVDRDRRNYIRRGVNALDGPFHADFPFDTLKANSASNDRGLLNYAVASSRGEAYPTGTFVTVYFRARRANAGANVTLLRARPGAPRLTTVSYFGFEILETAEPLSRTAVRVTIDNPEEGAKPRDWSTEVVWPASTPAPAPDKPSSSEDAGKDDPKESGSGGSKSEPPPG